MAAEYGCVSGQNAGRNHSNTGQAGGLVAHVLLLIVLRTAVGLSCTM